MSREQSGSTRVAASNQRLVLCECDACKAKNSVTGGRNIPKFLRDYHMKMQTTWASDIRVQQGYKIVSKGSECISKVLLYNNFGKNCNICVT